MSDTKNRDMVIERTIQAPAEAVWRMWTEAANFQKWYGPTGATIPSAQMDAVVGGTRHICMEMDTPGGQMQMWFKGEYLQITPLTKLVYTEYMSDKDGNTISPSDMGMPEDTPETTTVTVELTDEHNTTNMRVTHAGVPAGSPGEMGWKMALDKMEGLFL